MGMSDTQRRECQVVWGGVDVSAFLKAAATSGPNEGNHGQKMRMDGDVSENE